MPRKSTQHVDTLLSNVSVKYTNSEYIADQVCPEVPVKKQSDKFLIYDRNFRIPETKRAEKGLAREHDFEVSNATYVLEKHALKTYISDDEQDNFDVGDLRADATEELTDKIQARRDKVLASYFTSSAWSLGVSLAAASYFTAQTITSDPVPVFDTGATTVIANSGRKPNWAVMSRAARIAIKNHISVLDRVKYTSREMTTEILKGLLDLEKIVEHTAVEDTAQEGLSSSISSIFPDDAILMGYSPARPGLKVPSTFYKFKKSKPAVKRWVDEERDNAEAIEVQENYQIRQVASLTAYYIKDVL